MNVWLITWNVLQKREPNLDKIAAIHNGRRSDKWVGELMEALYLRSNYSAFDLAQLAKHPSQNRFKTIRHGVHLLCGSSPCWIHGRIVEDFVVTVNEVEQTETLTWREPDQYANAKDGGIEIVEVGKHQTYTRKLYKPISNDTWHPY